MISEHEKIMKILLINLAYIGDVVTSSPISRALGLHYNKAQIDILVTPQTSEIAKVLPNINNVIIYDKFGKDKGIGLLNLITRLRKNQYNLAITTNEATRSSLISFFCGAPCRIGFNAQWSQLFLTHAVAPDCEKDNHISEKLLKLLEPLHVPKVSSRLTLDLSKTNEPNLSQKQQRELILCPISRVPRKDWTKQGFADIIKHFSPPSPVLSNWRD